MSGAQAYTTSRGKNKKRKEGVRKDNKNNGERKLKTKLKDLSGFSGPKEPVGIVAGHLMGGGATGVSSVLTRIKENPQEKLKALRERCCNSSCSKTAGELGVTLKECSICRTVKYCSRECQVNDWKAGHGKLCKTLSEGGGKVAAIAQQAHESSSDDDSEDDDDDSEDEEDGDHEAEEESIAIEKRGEGETKALIKETATPADEA